PPVAPVVSLPVEQGDVSNLVCLVTTPSADPEGDVVQYQYAWYRNAVIIPPDPFSPALLSQIDNTDTVVGDLWYCVVTPSDGDMNGTAATSVTCEIILGGTTPSSISAGVVPSSITLGQSVTVSGAISPAPPSGAVVTFSSTSPSAVVSAFPNGVVIPAGAYTQTFYPNEASEGRPAWSLTASWPGDLTYKSATSPPTTFTVLKSACSVALSLSASSVPLNYTGLQATATVTAPLPSELSGLLSGLTMNLYMKKPDGSSPAGVPVVGTTDASGVAVITSAAFAAAGIVFDMPGTWQFLVTFPGNDNFLSSSSSDYDLPTSVRLTVKDRAGYAILVLGKLDAGGEGQAAHAKTLDYAYRAFRDRGFDADDIFYLREGPVNPAPDIMVDDTSPCQADVQWAIQTWARDKMNASAAPLYLVFLDHGSVGAFYVYAGAYDETRVITPVELKGYLDTLQGSLNLTAQDQNILFLYGACHSGSFVNAAAGPHRMVITSSLDSELSHRGVITPPDTVRDGEVFITEFFRQAREGKDFKFCFDTASVKIREYTFSASNGSHGHQTQHPLLEDNGDGMGSSGVLSATPGEDGAVAFGTILGYGVNAGDSAGWAMVSPARSLATGVPVGQILAQATVIPATGCNAWIEVKTPAYAGSTPADGLLPDFQQQVAMAVFPFELGISNPAAGEFRWETFGTTFDTPGTYQVFYYIKDGFTGKTSTHMLTTIYRASAGNQPPTPVTLDKPDNGGTVHSTVFFAWTASTDPDDDPLTYRLEVAQDAAFTTGLIVRNGIQNRWAELTTADGIQDLTTYYWRVIAVDAYGAESTPNDVWTFYVDNNNSLVPGTIIVTATDMTTGLLVPGAAVAVPLATFTGTTDEFGECHFEAELRQNYTIQVSAPGYAMQSKVRSIETSGTAIVEFFLQQQYTDGDWVRNPANGHYYKLTAPMSWDAAR
ncbi:MAG: hypothetical protein QG656_1727, partial [Candidatus Hydrogenedentes bacterium]|nr:hypothetical protein [Candidatus Hydrogenedentota bacterium]